MCLSVRGAAVAAAAAAAAAVAAAAVAAAVLHRKKLNYEAIADVTVARSATQQQQLVSIFKRNFSSCRNFPKNRAAASETDFFPETLFSAKIFGPFRIFVFSPPSPKSKSQRIFFCNYEKSQNVIVPKNGPCLKPR